MGHELKYSMLPFCLLVDNYTSRGYKELGRSKLKAPKISSCGEQSRQLAFQDSESVRFSAREQSETRMVRGRGRETREEKEGLTIIRTLPQLHASSKIVFNEGL